MHHIRHPNTATGDWQLSQRPRLSTRRFRPPARLQAVTVHAAKKPSSSSSSPWSSGPGSSSKKKNSSSSSSSSKGKRNSKQSNKSSKTAPTKSTTNKGSSSSSKTSTVVVSSVPSSSPTAGSNPSHQLTPPLTPQLLDPLSPPELTAAPLWSTFTGHCEGEWLGQYAAYTPWAGDPEAVWVDESGAQLMVAYSRTSEDRQIVKVDSSSSSSSDVTAAGSIATAAAAAAVEGSNDDDDDDDGQNSIRSFDELDLLVRSTVRSASINSLIGGTAAAAAAAGSSESAGSSETAPAAAAVSDDSNEYIGYNAGGVVVFNGGSYSLGPECIETSEVVEDDWAAAAAAAGGDDEDNALDPDQYQQQQEDLYASLPFSTVVIEQCLVSSGDSRLRLVVTLKIRQPPGEQEIDVEVARLLLYKEHWYGTAASTSGTIARKNRLLDRQSDAPAPAATSSSSSSSSVLSLLPSHQFDVPVIDLARPQPQQLAGSWNVFLVTANPIIEENPDTLQSEQVWVYTSREERQQWHVPGITSSAALGSSSSSTADAAAAATADLAVDDVEGSGGSFWLPGGAVVTLRMVDLTENSSSSTEAAAADSWSGSPESNGNGRAAVDSSNSSSGRGLLVGLHWLLADGSCEFVERQYAADGQLVEVRHGSAVLGGWCGGRG